MFIDFFKRLFKKKSIKVNNKLCCPYCKSKRVMRKKIYMNSFFKLYCLDCKKTSEFRIV